MEGATSQEVINLNLLHSQLDNMYEEKTRVAFIRSNVNGLNKIYFVQFKYILNIFKYILLIEQYIFEYILFLKYKIFLWS